MFFKKVLFFKYFLIIISFSFLSSQETKTYKFPPVKYVSIVSDLNKYYLYANGGYHADWYVGYNNAWIVKLPPVDTSGYVKAFVGAKLGRAKNLSYPNSKNLKPRESKIFVSISNSPKFSSKAYVLCDNADIPFEPLEDESIEGVDSSKWFWTEISIKSISNESDNYIALWAESRDLKDSMSSPIIAAAYLKDNQENVWVNPSIRGSVFNVDNLLEIPISNIKPAVVIKLIPENDYKVIIKNFNIQRDKNEYFFNWTVISADTQKSWLEISYDRIKWNRFSKYLFMAPFSYSFSIKELPNDLFYVRACASDNFENIECSTHISLNNIQRKQEDR